MMFGRSDMSWVVILPLRHGGAASQVFRGRQPARASSSGLAMMVRAGSALSVCCTAPQVFVGNNTAGFVVTYDGLPLASMPNDINLQTLLELPVTNTISIPANSLNASSSLDIYLNVACGSSATATANLTLTFISTCDIHMLKQEMLRITCMQPCPVLQWSTPTAADTPILMNQAAAAAPGGLTVQFAMPPPPPHLPRCLLCILASWHLLRGAMASMLISAPTQTLQPHAILAGARCLHDASARHLFW